MTAILVLHGATLNHLGQPRMAKFGPMPLTELDAAITRHATARSVKIECRQSNHEGVLVDAIQSAADQGFSAIVLNPASFTFYSYAVREVVAAATIPVIEVHLSNIYAYDLPPSLTAAGCRGLITGFGPQSYLLGIDAALACLGTAE